MNREDRRRWFLGLGLALLGITATGRMASAQAAHVRWDIVNLGVSH